MSKPKKMGPDMGKGMPMGRPGFSAGTFKRVIKMLMEYYPVLFPVSIACIVFCSVTSTLPAIFQQQIIEIIEDWYKTGDWAGASKIIVPKVLILAGFYVVSIIGITLQSQLMVYITQGFLNKSRKSMFNGMQNLPIKYFDKN